MTDFIKKSFDQPDENQNLPLFKKDIVKLGDWDVNRLSFEPGWRWTEHTAPHAKTDTCQVRHPLVAIISGRLMVQMDDGRKEEFGPGDVGYIPPGHDSWVIGDEPVVAIDFQPVNP